MTEPFVTEDHTAAVHESAHVVIARVMGLDAGGARLLGNGFGSARVEWPGDDAMAKLRRCEWALNSPQLWAANFPHFQRAG